MKRPAKFWILTILLIVLTLGGFYGMVMNKITQIDKASRQAWWFLIPSFPIAIYYAYASTFSYYKTLPFWKNLLGASACTLFFLLVLVKSFQGYLCIYNSSFGIQKNFSFKGFINYVERPRHTGRLMSHYTLQVTLDSSREIIKMNTKAGTYEAGQRLEMEMKIGSLGYIYLPK